MLILCLFVQTLNVSVFLVLMFKCFLREQLSSVSIRTVRVPNRASGILLRFCPGGANGGRNLRVVVVVSVASLTWKHPLLVGDVGAEGSVGVMAQGEPGRLAVGMLFSPRAWAHGDARLAGLPDRAEPLSPRTPRPLGPEELNQACTPTVPLLPPPLPHPPSQRHTGTTAAS